MEICLVPANTNQQLEQIKDLYMEAFPENERKPFSLITEKRKQGAMDILSIESSANSSEPAKNNRILGEAIIAKDGDIALLDYFAISPAFRGSGTGSHALKLLQQHYDSYRFMLEIESTVHPVPDLKQRLHRKNFYRRGGMECMDYLVSLFDVEMEIMTYNCTVAFEEYYALYENIFGSYMQGRVIKLNSAGDNYGTTFSF